MLFESFDCSTRICSANFRSNFRHFCRTLILILTNRLFQLDHRHTQGWARSTPDTTDVRERLDWIVREMNYETFTIVIQQIEEVYRSWMSLNSILLFDLIDSRCDVMKTLLFDNDQSVLVKKLMEKRARRFCQCSVDSVVRSCLALFCQDEFVQLHLWRCSLCSSGCVLGLLECVEPNWSCWLFYKYSKEDRWICSIDVPSLLCS